MDKLGGRKFFLSFLTLIIGSLLQWFGKLDPSGTSYIFLVGLVLGAYTVSNVTQKVKAHNEISGPTNPGSGSGTAG